MNNDSLNGVNDFVACLTIEIGPNLIVEESADVSFNAGESVVVNSEILISSNATTLVNIDPMLFCDLTADVDEDSSDACLDCDDDNSFIFPGAQEVCDGLDNDCDAASPDGSEDPGLGLPCDGADSDLCLEGTQSCSGGILVCSDSTDDSPEVCGDELDNDCDGFIDEGC